MVRRTVVLTPPNTLLGRLVWALATIVVMALGFFMLTAGLVVVLALTAAAALRIWWRGRHERRPVETLSGDLLEVEYTVEPDDPVVLPPGLGRR
ncbi:MAG TPA: hypothetical protein QGG47_02905 [Acidobacteriota bacterium]|nr:hypothetical protein [Acidobacteriota bacterium]